jgi:transcriptional regulator with AAA-type ATPase domain
MVRKIESEQRRPSRWLAERLARELGIAEEGVDAFLLAARGGSRRPGKGGPQNKVSPPSVVGRNLEITQVAERLERALAGNGDAVLVSGEAGIGKSHLAAVALDHAAQLGFATVRVPCYQIGSRTSRSSAGSTASYAMKRPRRPTNCLSRYWRNSRNWSRSSISATRVCRR